MAVSVGASPVWEREEHGSEDFFEPFNLPTDRWLGNPERA